MSREGKVSAVGGAPLPGSMTLATRSLTDFAIAAPEDFYRRRAIIGQPRLVSLVPGFILATRGEDVVPRARGNQVYARQDDRLSIRALQLCSGEESEWSVPRGELDQPSARWQLSQLGRGTSDPDAEPGPRPGGADADVYQRGVRFVRR